MSLMIVNSFEKAKFLIIKKKLFGLIRKSPNKQFTYSQSPTSKVVTVVVTL